MKKKNINKIANKCPKTAGFFNKLNHVLPLNIKTLLYNPPQRYCYIAVWGQNGSLIQVQFTYRNTERLFKTLDIENR